MRTFYRIVAQLTGLFSRNKSDHDLDHEMQAHLEMAIDDNIKRGLNPEEARRRALIESGGIELAKEAVRDQRTLPRVESLVRDLSFAWRSIRRSPGFAVPVVISLALGIGLNTSVFTMMEDVLRRPLPYANEAELVTVGQLHEANNNYDKPSVNWTTYEQDLAAWQSGSRTLEGIAAFAPTRGTIEGRTGAEYAVGGNTTANFLNVVGAEPMRGRWFTGDEMNARVVVLSYELWKRQFALDANVVGQTLKIQGEIYTVLGVLPRNVGLPLNAQYWTPCQGCLLMHQIVARPRAGVPLATISAELEALSPSVSNNQKSGHKMQLVVQSLHEQLFGSARPALQLLTGAAALLFLIACANVANLSLARTLERRRELAVRVALGAGQSSLAVMLLAENFLLAVLGAGLGLAVAYLASSTLIAVAPVELPNVRNVEVNAGSALFAFLLAMFAAALVSIAPVLNIIGNRTQPMMAPWSASSGRGRRLNRVRHGLVTTQLALTLLLMTGAGLLIRSVAALARPDRLGFSPAGVVIANVRLNHNQYPDSTSFRVFTERLTSQLSALPGVENVAVGPAPLLASTRNLAEGVDGVFTYHDPVASESVNHNIWLKDVGPEYLTTFRIKLRAGRNFRTTDDAHTTPVALLNVTAARIFFGDRNPVGLTIPTRAFSRQNPNPPVVVGVVDDLLQRDLTVSANPEVFFPVAQRGFSPIVTVAIRTNVSVNTTINAARAVLRAIDPALAASRLESMNSILDASLSTHTFLLWLLVGFAGLALALSVIGLYAIVSYLVSQRTVEIGVRMALGAQRVHVLGLVLGEGAVLVIAGVIIGSLAAFALSQLLAKFLYEVQPHDALTFIIGPLILSVVALVAGYVPAVRATRVNPAITLRAD